MLLAVSHHCPVLKLALRKLSVTQVKAVDSLGSFGFLYHWQLASHNLAKKVTYDNQNKVEIQIQTLYVMFLEVVVQTTTYIQFAFVVLHSWGGSWELVTDFPYVVLHGIFGKF